MRVFLSSALIQDGSAVHLTKQLVAIPMQLQIGEETSHATGQVSLVAAGLEPKFFRIKRTRRRLNGGRTFEPELPFQRKKIMIGEGRRAMTL